MDPSFPTLMVYQIKHTIYNSIPEMIFFKPNGFVRRLLDLISFDSIIILFLNPESKVNGDYAKVGRCKKILQ